MGVKRTFKPDINLFPLPVLRDPQAFIGYGGQDAGQAKGNLYIVEAAS